MKDACGVLIPKSRIIDVLTKHAGEQIDLGLIMNMLVEIEMPE